MLLNLGGGVELPVRTGGSEWREVMVTDTPQLQPEWRLGVGRQLTPFQSLDKR